MGEPRQMASVPIPTPFGEFEGKAFEHPSGLVYLALLKGDVRGVEPVLTRLHSECLTGDALGSLRCDCGVQLRLALRRISAEGCGVLVYATGQEGRGVGLINKLRAYAEQDRGADTLDANTRLGLPVDSRRYGDAGTVLTALGVRSVRLLTNNPLKVRGLREAGVRVSAVEPIATAAHVRNMRYLRTKSGRLGHVEPAGEVLGGELAAAVDVSELLGPVEPRPGRPYVVLKYAQTVDGRIATRTGDSKWITSEAERRISHAMRASCDAVLVGVGTVLADDPRLTVRMVPGASPSRLVLDSALRTPLTARVLDGEAATTLLTTTRSSPARRQALRARHVGVQVVEEGAGGVDVGAAVRYLRASGVTSLLVEGGAKVLTSMLAARVVDRVVVGLAPTIIGRGTEAVGQLGVDRVADGIRLANRRIHVMSDDLLLSWDVVPAPTAGA